MKSQSCENPLKFHFIALSNTFFLMPKVKLGKETVKFLAIFDHQTSKKGVKPEVGFQA